MRSPAFLFIVLVVCLGSPFALTTYCQDARAGSLNGRWKDDINGQEINISLNASSGRVVATYTRPNKTCKNPDREGRPVPFQVDFDGDYSGGRITGRVYYCENHLPGAGPPGGPHKYATYTIGLKSGALDLTVSQDGTKLTGTFSGARGSERISFTKLQPNEGDLVILRSGQTEKGILKGCVSSRCQIGSASLSRSQILWIGLSTQTDIPPAISDTSRDEVHLRAGGLRKGRLVGINTATVVTETGSFARSQVAWIYLAPPGSRPPLEGEINDQTPSDDMPASGGKPPSSPKPTPSPVPSPSPWGTQAPRPGPSTAPTNGDCMFWEGEVTREDDQQGTRRKVTYNARLREGPRSTGQSVQHGVGVFEIPLINDGSIVEERDDEDRMEGSTHVFGVGSGNAKVLNPGITFGTVGHLTVTAAGKHVSYRFEMEADEGSKMSQTRHWVGGTPPRERVTQYENSFMMVPVGEGSDPVSLRPFSGDGHIMEGEYTYRSADGNNTGRVTWHLRGGLAPCNRPRDLSGDPPPKTDPCGPPTSELALLKHALDQEKALRALNGQQYRDIRRLEQQAGQWQNDFAHAARDCELWQAAQVLMNFLVSNTSPTETLTISGLFTPGEAEAAAKPGKELANFLSWLEKISTGDASWILPNYEFKDYFSAEDAWEGFQAAYSQIAPASTAEAMLADLRSCGSPSSSGVMEGATNYLRIIQQIEPKLREANKTLNDIRSKDQEVMDKWNKFHQACVDSAKCRGTDPKACDTPPQ